jgi:phosphoribosylformylglycinamidine synthase
MKLNAEWKTPEERGLKEPDLGRLEQDPLTLLHDMLKRENIASREFLQREYDQRVQGKTIIPPFIGTKSDVPSDGAVHRVEFGNDVGVAVGIGLNPAISKIDTYHMSQYCANEGLMRVVAVGADPDKAANNGNYCWPDVLPDMIPGVVPGGTDEPEYKTAQLVRAAKGQRDFAMDSGVATISGKDSMKVQGKISDVHGGAQMVYSQPTLQFATVGTVPDVKKSMTSDFQEAGDLVYMVGLETKDELGASELYNMMGETGANAPEVDVETSMDVYRALHRAMQQEYVESCKVCTEGGLAVAVSQAAFAGELGADIDLDDVPHSMSHEDGNLYTKIQYSNSASRFVVTVMPENREAFEEMMGDYAAQIGVVTEKDVVFKAAGQVLLEENNQELKESWQSTFKHKLYNQNEA